MKYLGIISLLILTIGNYFSYNQGRKQGFNEGVKSEEFVGIRVTTKTVTLRAVFPLNDNTRLGDLSDFLREHGVDNTILFAPGIYSNHIKIGSEILTDEQLRNRADWDEMQRKHPMSHLDIK